MPVNARWLPTWDAKREGEHQELLEYLRSECIQSVITQMEADAAEGRRKRKAVCGHRGCAAELNA
jgi:hypothetical protein